MKTASKDGSVLNAENHLVGQGKIASTEKSESGLKGGLLKAIPLDNSPIKMAIVQLNYDESLTIGYLVNQGTGKAVLRSIST